MLDDRRRTLTAAINAYVATAIGDQRDHITSIVIVGGDDMIPFAPVAQHTSQFNEAQPRGRALRCRSPGGRHARARRSRRGGTCDPCATPLSAAAATNHILTDDPYGLADGVPVARRLPVRADRRRSGASSRRPTRSAGAIARFVAADGLLDADSTLTGGYGAWSELPAHVTDKLDWRRDDAGDARGDRGRKRTSNRRSSTRRRCDRASCRSTRTPTRRACCRASTGAEAGAVTDTDLLTAADRRRRRRPAERRARLPDRLPRRQQPADGATTATSPTGPMSSQPRGGYVGNTGYGLASNVDDRAQRAAAGRSTRTGSASTVDGTPVSSAGALTYAKQSYLGGLGLYSGYDEKALMEAVYYGLPMYTAERTSGVAPKDAPLPTSRTSVRC